MSAARQVISMLLIAAMLLGATAILLPSDACAGVKHLLACGTGAGVAAKWLCPFGPAWCTAGLLGGCIVGIIVMELADD
jgi:hypothetical protein